MPDLHPLFVHLPIGLLSVYSLLELVSLWPRVRKINFNSTKLFLLVVGVFGALFALFTGSLAEDKFRGSELARVVEVHSFFAGLTTGLYALLAVLYLAARFRPDNFFYLQTWAVRILSYKYLISLIALAAFICLSITGGLGGIMVYGPDADPLTRWLSAWMV